MSEYINSRLSALKAYVPGEQPADMDRLIKLNTNENPFPPSPAVLKAVDCSAVTSLRRYSDPTCRLLREALARADGVKPENIVCANGSDEILALLFHGFCEKGAAFPDVTYGFYSVWCDMFGVEKKIVPLDGEYRINIADYAALPQTLFIANPNAPTGIALKKSEIAEMLAQNRRRLVVVDEAYVDFGAQSAVGLINEFDNLVITRTFSKSRCLAGARVGWAIAPALLAADLEKLRSSFNPYNINSLSSAAACAAANDADYFESCKKAVIENRAKLSAALTALGCKLTDSSANFIFVSLPDISGEEYYKALRKRGILVRWFDAPRTRDRVRMTVGDEEAVTAVIKATEEIICELRR